MMNNVDDRSSNRCYYPDFSNMYWYAKGDMYGCYETLDDITIGDILNTNLPNIFIFQDIHKQILNTLKQDWISENDYSILKDVLECLTVKQCEMLYRALITEQLEVFAQKYEVLADSGILIIAPIYSWLLPYYVDYTSFEDELSNLPKLDINVRPNSIDNYPHPFALHYAHHSISTITDVYNSIKSGKGIGHNDVKTDLKKLAHDIAKRAFDKDTQNILRNSDVAQIIYDVTYLKRPDLSKNLPRNTQSIKEWIKKDSPSYASRRGRISQSKQKESDQLVDILTNEILNNI